MLITEFEQNGVTVRVLSHGVGTYKCTHDGVDKHGILDTDEVIRLLGHYLESANYRLNYQPRP